MNICIAVYSKTGNTLSVAEKLRDSLVAAGHTVKVERFLPVDDMAPTAADVKFQSIPDLAGYEGYVFAGPVRAFNISPPTEAMLSHLPELAGKKIACFTTKQIPFNGFGGRRTISIMKRHLEAAGAIVGETGIIFWPSKKRDVMIEDVVARLTAYFK